MVFNFIFLPLDSQVEHHSMKVKVMVVVELL
jgi:hypothetical protein